MYNEDSATLVAVELLGQSCEFETSGALFSPRALDTGTRLMLENTELREHEKVLDLGCGWGVVGVLLAKALGEMNVTLCDADADAVEIARRNAVRNGVSGVRVFQGDGLEAVPDSGYTLILSNPPYHADFGVPKRFIEKGFNRLAPGGRMVMVTHRKEWYRNKLASIFGGVHILEHDGYFLFTAEKRAMEYANKLKPRKKRP